MADEVAGEAAVGEELAPGRLRGSSVGEQRPGRAVEARHLGQHPHEARVGDAPRLGEHARRTAAAGVRQSAALARDAHAHLGGLGRHAELAEEAQQVGVGPLVVDDEAAVDAQRGRRDPGTSWVCAWPPSRLSASKRVTSWAGDSTWAAVSPATPAPMTAAVGCLDSFMVVNVECLSKDCQRFV